MIHCSAAEGQKFQEEVIRVSKIIEDLGSNPIKDLIRIEKEKENAKEQKAKN
jgi:hypothetical protein